jgi:hypothetical protein
MSDAIVIHVSAQGNDEWSGRLAAPAADGSDGPLKTIAKAVRIARQIRAAARFELPIEVVLGAGRHFVGKTLTLAPEDSGVTYRAADGQQAVIDAGIAIDGWRETTVNGASAWVADASAAMQLAGGYFRSLFVHAGDQSFRAQRPTIGCGVGKWLWMEDVPGTDPKNWNNRAPYQKTQFVARPGDVKAFRNITDVDVVVLHWWIEDRQPIASFDPATRMVTLQAPTDMTLVDDLNGRFARYYLDNVFEAMNQPGQWYLDRAEKRIYYIPLAGQSIAGTQFFAGGLHQAVKVAGNADEGKYVERIAFDGVTFEHGDWSEPAGRGQSAYGVGAFVTLEAARNCRIENCSIRHAGLWGLELVNGCANIRVVGNEISDLGAGGIKVNGADAFGPLPRRTSRIRISDNQIGRVGRVYHRATGVLIAHASDCELMHNHIFDGYYTGVSVGYVWGYGPSVACNNRVEKNHIHQFGQGWLNDMGGIYLLGVQPGTALRGNLIHDVQGAKYGGWGIYPDEGNSYIVIENNVVCNTSSQLFHLHFGREIAIRNNIWAFGREGLIAISRGNECNWPEKGVLPNGMTTNCFTFERNIVITDGQPVFIGGMDDPSGNLETNSFISDLNVFWDVAGKPLHCGNAGHLMADKGLRRRFEWSQWLALGQDAHSAAADPRLAKVSAALDCAQWDLTPAADSPARKMGFKPIDISDVGPRPLRQRGGEMTDMRPSPATALM